LPLLLCMGLKLAPNGHAHVVAIRPFLGVERTSGSYVAKSESDPVQTLALQRCALMGGRAALPKINFFDRRQKELIF
jgi:hypothetical protein